MASLHQNTPPNFNQVSDLALRLPKTEQLKLIKTLRQANKVNSVESKTLTDLRQSLTELKNGTLETRPFDEFVAELNAEGYL